MPPPSEWPTTVARRWPSTISRSRGLAVTQQVGRKNRVAIGQLRDYLLPLARVTGDPMNQQHQRSLTGRAVTDPMAVEDRGSHARLDIHGPRAGVAAARGPRRGDDHQSLEPIAWIARVLGVDCHAPGAGRTLLPVVLLAERLR